VRILLVADLHYTLKQLDWVASVAGDYDLVVMAGDHLDIASIVAADAQIAVVLEYLSRIAAKTTLVACSGNHDLNARNEYDERAAPWLDAMAHGLPVLASEVGAARRVIGEDGERGWLVPPGEPPALAAQLARILTSPRDWPALRRRCRAYADGRTLEAWTRRIGELCALRWQVRYADGRLWI